MVVSIDGFTETKDKDMEWQAWGEDMINFMDNFMEGTDVIILGRNAFELMENYWPSEKVRKEEPVIAGRMNSIHKLVFSKTRNTTNWENTSFATDIDSEIAKLKQRPGKDIVLFGGQGLAQTFMKKGLVDEYQLIVSPTALGNGNPLFTEKHNLELLNATTMPSGNVILKYKNKQN